MADFVQTMKDWRRMCDVCQIEKGGACGCYPAGHYATCSMKEISKEADLSCDNRYFERLEKVITAWALEHPEPVYPTFGEWMEDMMCDMSAPIETPQSINVWMYQTPIPVDIAQKLGIEPKEDT